MQGYIYINVGELSKSVDEEVEIINEMNEQLSFMKDKAVSIEKSWEGTAKNQFVYMLRIEISNLEEKIVNARKLVAGIYDIGTAISKVHRSVVEKIEGISNEG